MKKRTKVIVPPSVNDVSLPNVAQFKNYDDDYNFAQ